MDYSTISDEDLSQMLKDYGVDVGPINVATRGTYERKLAKLKTGQASPPSQHFDPVDDDDDDEVELRIPTTSTPSSRNTPSAIPVPTQMRARREVLDQSSIPRVESRPPLAASRRVTSSGDTPMSRHAKVQESVVEPAPSRGIPLWVKLLVLCVVGLLSYLIYTNMEPSVTSNIPNRKVEV